MSVQLQTQLDSLAAECPGQVSFFARHLHSNDTVERMADAPQATMSAGKTLILLAYADAVSSQRLDPCATVTVQLSDVLPGTGVLRYFRPEMSFTLSDLAYAMITHSDNVATNLLLNALGGPSAVNVCLDAMGIHEARCVTPLFQGEFCVTSARALARLYEVVAQPEAANFPAAGAELARTILARHQDVEGMSRYLPWSPLAADFGYELPLKVYSKSGQFPGTQVEAGLYISGRGAYVAAAICSGLQDPRTNSTGPGSTFLATFGRLLYEAWGA